MNNVEKQKNRIYELMNGLWDLDHFKAEESSFVKNEFEEGKPCSLLCESIYQANRNLCGKLNVEEDEDVEKIINSYTEMMKICCMKMFDYGYYLASLRKDEEDWKSEKM